MPEPIGNISVLIEGDFSPLDKALGESVIAAELGGGKIAQAFNMAAGSTDEWTQALNHSTTATEAETDAIGAAADKFHGYSTAVENVLGPERDHLDDLAQMPKSYTEMSAAAQRAVEKLNEQVQAQEAGRDSLDKLTSGTISWGSALKLVGIDLSARGILEFAKNALEAFNTIEKGTIALQHLTGSAAGAQRALRDVISVSLDDALSLPAVLQAEQRFLAFGVAADLIPGTLRTIADTAAATGREFSGVANTFERIIESGQVQGRTLTQLGINLGDLAKALNVTESEAKKAFAALDQEDRIVALETALGKFRGTAEEVAQTIGGQWQRLATDFELTAARIGHALESPASFLVTSARSMLAGVNEEITNWAKVWRDTVVVVGEVTGKDIGAMKESLDGLIGKMQQSDHAVTTSSDTFQKAWTASTGALSAGASEVIKKQQDLDNVAIEAYHDWQDLIKAQREGKASLDDVTRAHADYEKALDASTPKLKTNTAAIKEMAAEYKAMGAGLGDATAGIGAVLALANAHFLGSSRTIIGTLKDQGAAFADWTVAAAKAFGEVDDKIEILGTHAHDTYPKITELMNQLGHFPSMSEQIAAGLTTIVTQTDRSRDAYGFLKGAADAAYQAVIDGGKSSVQIATDFNQVVSSTGAIIGTAVDESLAALGRLSTQIEKLEKQWKDFADGVGSFSSSLGLGTLSGGKGMSVSNPFVGLSSPDEMQKAMNDFMDQFAGSSPFSPGVRATYTAMEALLNFAIQDWYKKHPFFDSAGNAPAPKGSGGGGSPITPTSTSPGPTSPSSQSGDMVTSYLAANDLSGLKAGIQDAIAKGWSTVGDPFQQDGDWVQKVQAFKSSISDTTHLSLSAAAAVADLEQAMHQMFGGSSPLTNSTNTATTAISNMTTAVNGVVGGFGNMIGSFNQAEAGMRPFGSGWTEITQSMKDTATVFSGVVGGFGEMIGTFGLDKSMRPLGSGWETINSPVAPYAPPSFQAFSNDGPTTGDLNPRVLGGNSSTLNTVNNMTITTTPDEQSLLDQLVIMLQRRGIRM